MRVDHWLLLDGVLWLIAGAANTVVHPRTEEDHYEADECHEFRAYFTRWTNNRIGLINKIAALHDELTFLPVLLDYRLFLQWASVVIGGASAAVHAFNGRTQVAMGSAWMGVVYLYAVKYGVKSWFERAVHKAVTEAHSLASLDTILQASMVAQPCDEPPFLGIDRTVDEVEAKVGILRPLPWSEHCLDLNEPSKEELCARREWLLAMYDKLMILMEVNRSRRAFCIFGNCKYLPLGDSTLSGLIYHFKDCGERKRESKSIRALGVYALCACSSTRIYTYNQLKNIIHTCEVSKITVVHKEERVVKLNDADLECPKSPKIKSGKKRLPDKINDTELECPTCKARLFLRCECGNESHELSHSRLCDTSKIRVIPRHEGEAKSPRVFKRHVPDIVCHKCKFCNHSVYAWLQHLRNKEDSLPSDDLNLRCDCGYLSASIVCATASFTAVECEEGEC